MANFSTSRTGLVSGLSALALWASAAKSEDVWQDPPQQSFSAEALSGLASFELGDYKSGSTVKADEESDRCRLQPPVSRCATIILKTHIHVNSPAIVEEALSYLERAYPVDPIALHGNRRLPIKDASRALETLKLVAEVSQSIHGFSDPRSLRRALAKEISYWRAGGGVTLLSFVDSKMLGADSPLLAQINNLAAVDNLGDTYVSEQETAALDKAHRVLGESIASNVAVLKLQLGDYVAAEALALAGYTALLARHGERDSRTVSAAAILADVYRTRGKTSQAVSLSKAVSTAREQDPFAMPMQRIDALSAYAGDLPEAEREPHLKRALALLDAQVGKPQWPVLTKIVNADSVGLGKDITLMGTPMAELGAKTIKDVADRELQARRSRVLTALAMLKMATSPAEAERLATQATAASTNRLASTIAAIAIMAQVGKGVPINMAEFHLGQGEDNSLPVEHPDRIANAYAYTVFYVMRNPPIAPDYARKASQGALARLSQHRSFDEEAASEFAQYGGVFRMQVQANWLAAQRLTR